jgi:hypothetical protein
MVFNNSSFSIKKLLGSCRGKSLLSELTGLLIGWIGGLFLNF